jgi:hypothetical protein
VCEIDRGDGTGRYTNQFVRLALQGRHCDEPVGAGQLGLTALVVVGGLECLSFRSRYPPVLK